MQPFPKGETRVEAGEVNLKAAEETAIAAEARTAAARAKETAARDGLAEAERALGRIETEATTLSALLASASSGGAPVLDAVKVAPGFEAALGAAFGDDLDAPVDDAAPVHWRGIDASVGDPALPAGVESLSSHVDAPSVIARKLAQIGIVQRGDGSRLQRDLRPGQRLVSREGDLWRWDGYVAAAEAPTAAAQRLASRNRLIVLDGEIAAARLTVGDRRSELETANAEMQRRQ